MPPVSLHAPSVASESASASLISFVLIFAIALRVHRDFSTAVSSLPYNVRGGTPQFVETSHTAGKDFFGGPPAEAPRKTWLAAPAGCVRGCSPTHNLPAPLTMFSGGLRQLPQQKMPCQR